MIIKGSVLPQNPSLQQAQTLQTSLLLCRQLHTKGWQPGMEKGFLWSQFREKINPNLHSHGKEHNRASGIYALSTAHNASAELQQIKPQEGVQIYQYIDGVLVGGEEESAVRTAQDIWNRLNREGVEVPSAESPGPSKEVEFLGSWG